MTKKYELIPLDKRSKGCVLKLPSGAELYITEDSPKTTGPDAGSTLLHIHTQMTDWDAIDVIETKDVNGVTLKLGWKFDELKDL